MPRQDFVDQLRSLGYEVESPDGDRVIIPFTVDVGRYIGQKVRLGFIVGNDFPMNPPGGPHISPRLLPLNKANDYPLGGVHESPSFGPEWEYWSRPYNGWTETDRTVRTYLTHIRRLFLDLP
jgi:hypothetical protein